MRLTIDYFNSAARFSFRDKGASTIVARPGTNLSLELDKGMQYMDSTKDNAEFVVYRNGTAVGPYVGCTSTSDIFRYPNIKPGVYAATNHKHNGHYDALGLHKVANPSLKSDNPLPTVKAFNPEHPDQGPFATTVNIHRAIYAGTNYNGFFKSHGEPVSTGCFVICAPQWDSFMTVVGGDSDNNRLMHAFWLSGRIYVE